MKKNTMDIQLLNILKNILVKKFIMTTTNLQFTENFLIRYIVCITIKCLFQKKLKVMMNGYQNI